jgi:hypothetical protein
MTDQDYKPTKEALIIRRDEWRLFARTGCGVGAERRFSHGSTGRSSAPTPKIEPFLDTKTTLKNAVLANPGINPLPVLHTKDENTRA